MLHEAFKQLFYYHFWLFLLKKHVCFSYGLFIDFLCHYSSKMFYFSVCFCCLQVCTNYKPSSIWKLMYLNCYLCSEDLWDWKTELKRVLWKNLLYNVCKELYRKVFGRNVLSSTEKFCSISIQINTCFKKQFLEWNFSSVTKLIGILCALTKGHVYVYVCTCVSGWFEEPC